MKRYRTPVSNHCIRHNDEMPVVIVDLGVGVSERLKRIVSNGFLGRTPLRLFSRDSTHILDSFDGHFRGSLHRAGRALVLMAPGGEHISFFDPPTLTLRLLCLTCAFPF